MCSNQIAKKEQAHEDSIWTVSWAAKTNLIVTGGVDEKVHRETRVFFLFIFMVFKGEGGVP